MSTSEFNVVRTAAIKLSETLTYENPDNCDENTTCNYVSAISFDNDIDENVGFKTTTLVTDDFTRGGGTQYKPALEAAYNSFSSKEKEKNRFFVIFLSDGVPGDSETTYTPVAENIKKFLKPVGSEIEYGKLITVGFSTSLEKLSKISSEDCEYVGSDCYYEASSSDINAVFNDFFNIIQKEVTCSTYKNTKITIQLSENFNFTDGTKTKTIEKDLECNQEDFLNDTQTQTLLDKELYSLNFAKPMNKTLGKGSHSFSIIDSIQVTFYDGDNNEVSGSKIILSKDSFPDIILDISNVSVIN